MGGGTVQYIFHGNCSFALSISSLASGTITMMTGLGFVAVKYVHAHICGTICHPEKTQSGIGVYMQCYVYCSILEIKKRQT